MKQRSHSRRAFVKGSAATTVALLYSRVHGATLSVHEKPTIANDPRRPSYHLLPTRNWINDPNGPIYFDGKYHMFFQYNQESAIWGNMSWNHAISLDMIRWRNYPVAFTTTPGGPDEAGCFSGSTIVRELNGKKRVYALYTGVIKDKSKETIRNEGLCESQCIAWTDDPLLQKWTKREHPVISAPPQGLQVVGFRDPSVWKQHDIYYMIVGSGLEKVGGCVLLYQSEDLIDWKYMHPLAAGGWNGKPTSNPVDDGEMWECPEIFELDGQHLLIYSTERKVFWQSGVLDPETMTFKQKRTGLMDVGSFYAPKTQLDEKGRRILWGWIPEQRTQEEMLKAGWSGMISLPRILKLDNDGYLTIEFLPSLQSLRRDRLRSKQKNMMTSVTVPRATGEIACSGPGDEDWKIHIEFPYDKVLDIRYIAELRAFDVGNNRFALNVQDSPSIHLFFDGSVCELLLASRIGLVERFYYEGNSAPTVVVNAIGKTVRIQGWTLSAISKDRLTTLTKENL